MCFKKSIQFLILYASFSNTVIYIRDDVGRFHFELYCPGYHYT